MVDGALCNVIAATRPYHDLEAAEQAVKHSSAPGVADQLVGRLPLLLHLGLHLSCIVLQVNDERMVSCANLLGIAIQ